MHIVGMEVEQDEQPGSQAARAFVVEFRVISVRPEGLKGVVHLVEETQALQYD